MFIIDGHQDIAFNAVALGRDFTRAVVETRAVEGQRSCDIATLGLPDALTGGVGLVFGTLYVAPASAEHLAGEKVYHTPDEAYAQAHEQLQFYQKLATNPGVVQIQTRRDLAALCESWDAGDPRLGIVVLMEGADPIRTPAEVAEWQAAGVRIVGLAWSQTRYSGGTGAPGPLTGDGRALLQEMRRAGLALDVSHMAEQSFWEALDLFDGPVLASHTNCRALLPGPRADRHLSDDMIRALVARDSVIGVVLYNRFLRADWEIAQGKQAVGLDAVLDQIDHICQIAGNARHAAIGSDLDGGFGAEAIPHEIDSVADLGRIADALANHGYAASDVTAVMGGNWQRALNHVLPV